MAHFSLFAPEKIPYAIERYQKEIHRVFSVLESVLSKQEWVAAGHCTVSRISSLASFLESLSSALQQL